MTSPPIVSGCESRSSPCWRPAWPSRRWPWPPRRPPPSRTVPSRGRSPTPSGTAPRSSAAGPRAAWPWPGSGWCWTRRPRSAPTPAGSTTRGSWVSPWTSPGFGLTQLVSSWSATTPGDSWIEVAVRGRAADGTESSWDVLGRWTSGDAFTRRTTVSGQSDDLASVDVDTWVASAAGRADLVPAAGRADAPHRRDHRQPLARRDRRGGLAAARGAGRHVAARGRPGPGAGRAALLPDGAPRPLPALGRRR